ncbi:MAG TPA: sugar transferase [bacterium]|nr:sugar transferase [bacterium]
MNKKGAPKGPLWKFIGVDLLVILGALTLSFLIRFQEIRIENFRIYIALFPILVVIRLAAMAFFRMYDFSRNLTRFDIAYFTGWASLAAHGVEALAILYTAAFYGVEYQVSRYILFLNFLLSWGLAAGWRMLYLKRRRRWAYDRSRILIVGAGKLGESVQRDIQQYSRLGHEVVGLVDDDIENPGQETPILGKMRDLPDLVQKYAIDEIIVTSQGANRQELLEILSACQSTGCKIHLMPELYEVIIGQVNIGQVGGVPLIPVNPQNANEFSAYGKRIFDLVFGSLFLVLLLPVWGLIAVVIKLTSPGPVLYRQERVGQDGRLFTIYKFRTMYGGAETETGPVLSWDKDPRVTPVGRFLRHWRLDETPQLFNVLGGVMSLVGPRPERPQFVEKYKREIQAYRLRETVRPGMTGLAQIHGFYNSPVEHKLRYDLAYINSMSLRLDLKILFNTLWVVLSEYGHVSDRKKRLILLLLTLGCFLLPFLMYTCTERESRIPNGLEHSQPVEMESSAKGVRIDSPELNGEEERGFFSLERADLG